MCDYIYAFESIKNGKVRFVFSFVYLKLFEFSDFKV